MLDRRSFLQLGALAGGTWAARRALAGEGDDEPRHDASQDPEAETVMPPDPPRIVAPGGQVAVSTPDGTTLPWHIVDGIKVGHLVAMPVAHRFSPGLEAECWGYNGRTPGPTIEAVEGDRVRIYVTNRLPEPTTVHWHGVLLPSGMDGVAGLTQPAIQPGETFVYEFTFTRPGTFMYHPHYDEMTQIALGMMGMIVVHPRRPRGPRVNRDFVLMTHEWKLRPGARRPDPNEMNDFNLLTFNSRAYPGTTPLVIGRGERVRIRLGNLSPMDHHPIHLHGLHFEVTATDGGTVPISARYPETTVLVPVGSTRVIEFVAPEAGDWAMHCHMTHHVMNQMGHGMPSMLGADAQRIDRRVQSVLPGYMTMGHTGMGGMEQMAMPVPDNSIAMRGGAGPFGPIDMGGMFTLLKVRDRPSTEDGSGWYRHPAGTVAQRAEATRLGADGIDPKQRFE
jgi:FtsP/CotA-like multicopper oxidase with cupredoxin domain